MIRAVSTLLIALLLLSQSLFSLPHSHARTSVVEPEGHSARTHIHLHGTRHHHGHKEKPGGHDSESGSSSLPVEQSPDHDSDAVFAGETQLLKDDEVAKVAREELSVMCAIVEAPANVVRSRCSAGHNSPPLPRTKCALFLHTRSIRC